MPSITVEDYIKELYLQQGKPPEEMVAMGRLAAAMGVVPGTATSMVKALADSGLVIYEPRTGVRLTPSGQRLALHVLRRHRLVELFLVKVLGLDWSQVHDEADQLEHAVSERVLERIDDLLGHPTVDPHGDPIPTAKGSVSEHGRSSLADCPAKAPVCIARILDQDRAFLQFVEQNGLMPGVHVVVEQRDPAAEAVKVRVVNGASVSLGYTAAAKILVLPGKTPKS